MGNARIGFSVEETARLLGIHPNTLRRAIWRGEVKAARVGRRVVVPLAEVERLLGYRLSHDEAPRHGEGA